MKSNKQLAVRESGQVLGVLIIVVVVIGAGFWLLFSYRNSTRTEGIAFGRQVVERLAIHHDANFLAASLGPQAKLDLSPMMQQDLMAKLQQLGTPIGPLSVQGDVTFQSQFFEPHGIFTAQLNYPSGGMRMDLAISHPVGRWQIDTIGISTAAPP
jgi:hypothetical protein